MRKRLDIKPGDRFGKLTIIKEADKIIEKNGQHRRMMLCQCDCGNIKTIGLRHLTSGGNKACGCQRSSGGIKTRFNPTHYDGDFYLNKNGYNYLYCCWAAIKQRCYNTNNKAYKRYGGRGIEMYKPWLKNYQAFKTYILTNLGDRPKDHSLDRINNDGHYEPGNLRWADYITQNNNMSSNKKQ